MTQPFELPRIPIGDIDDCNGESAHTYHAMAAYGRRCFEAGRRDATMRAVANLVHGNPEFTVERIAEKLALSSDAARYRWLRENAYIELQCDSPRVAGWAPENLDAKVDAARRASPLPTPEGAQT